MFVVMQRIRELLGRLGALGRLWPRTEVPDLDEFDGIEAAAGGLGF